MPLVTDPYADLLAAQVQAVRDVYTAELVSTFTGLGSWRSRDIGSWAPAAADVVVEAESLVAELADGIFDAQIADLLGDVSGVPVDVASVVGPATRAGVAPEEVYARAFKPVWKAVGDGKPLEHGVSSGASRIAEMFHLDLERTVDLTAINKFANENRIVGYRRVLTGTHNCALCILASTQIYHKRQLKGIHPNCKCKVRPLASFEEPKTLDRDLIEQVHAAVASKFGVSDRAARQIDYRKILLTRKHGEYGPTLTFRKYNFTGPSDLKTPGE
jgi:hypothetical protein